MERQSYSVMILLSWRGPCLANGQRERVDVNAKDGTGSTGKPSIDHTIKLFY